MHLNAESIDTIKRFGLNIDQIFYPSEFKAITNIVRELEFEHFSPRENSETLKICNLNEQLIKLSRSVAQNEAAIEKSEYTRMRVARRELVLNCMDQWNVELIASKVGLSPSRFHAKYKMIFGTTPIDDVIRARIRKAQLLLRSTDKTAKEISEICGYENETHFNRQFKKLVGTTPCSYRKNNK